MEHIYLESFAEYLAAGGRLPSTIKLRRAHIRAAITAIHKPVHQVTERDLITYLSAPGWSPSTRRSHRASLRLFFEWIHRNGITESNPAAGVPTVIQPRAIPRPAADTVIATAIAGAPPRVALMLELMAYAGLRRMEVAKVHTRDVIITSHSSAIRVTGKGGHTRIVPVPGHLATKIRDRRGWLFPGDDHGHLSAAYVGKLVSRALPDGVTGHQLRHRYATEGYRRGHDIRAVQELLGHAKLDTTMIYTHVTSDQTSAVASLTWRLSS